MLRRASLYANKETQTIYWRNVYVISFYTPNRSSQVKEMRKGRGGGSSVSFFEEKEMEARAALLFFTLFSSYSSSFPLFESFSSYSPHRGRPVPPPRRQHPLHSPATATSATVSPASPVFLLSASPSPPPVARISCRFAPTVVWRSPGAWCCGASMCARHGLGNELKQFCPIF